MGKKNKQQKEVRARPNGQHLHAAKVNSSRKATATSTMVARSTARGQRPGYPRERVVTLRYFDMHQLNSGTGNAAKYQYRLNSAFDPDLTGAGSQPYQFDQWSALYNHYVVEAAQVTVQWDGFNASPVICGHYVSDDATIAADAADLVMAGGTHGLITNGTVPCRFELNFDTSRFFARGSVATDSELRASVGANPSEVAILTLFVQDINRLTALATGFTISIDYRVRFMEPKDVPPSTKKDATASDVRAHMESRYTPEDGEWVFRPTQRTVPSSLCPPGGGGGAAASASASGTATVQFPTT